MVTFWPPAAFTAAITSRISREFAASAAFAVAARESTPNEKTAVVGTADTEPVPETVIESPVCDGPSTARAPSGRATPATAAAATSRSAARATRFIGLTSRSWLSTDIRRRTHATRHTDHECLRPTDLPGEPLDELRASIEVELPVDPCQVELHGLGAQEQGSRNLTVREAPGDLKRDLQLLWCQLVAGLRVELPQASAARRELPAAPIGPPVGTEPLEKLQRCT